MERKTWTIDVGGEQQIIGLEHEPNEGKIFLNETLMEEWELWKDGDSDHSLWIKGHHLGVHLRYDSDRDRYTYDLSLDGISVVHGRSVGSFRSTGSAGGKKGWLVELEDGVHRLELEHLLYDKQLIRLDGQLAVDGRFFKEEDVDHLLFYRGHRLGVHLRREGKERFRYDLSVDGVSLETGDPVAPFQSSPMMECRKKIWWLDPDGPMHRVELEHKGLSNKKRILVDGELILETGFSFEHRDGQHPFTIAEHRCALFIRETAGDLYQYDLILDGISLETGEGVDVDFAKTASAGGRRRWMLRLNNEVHTIEVERRRRRVRIWVNGVVREELKRGEGDSLHSFTMEGYELTVLVRKEVPFCYNYHLIVDGVSVDTGERMYPLKVVGEKIRWQFDLKDGQHRVELMHGLWSGRRQISVDGVPVVKKSFSFEINSLYSFRIKGNFCVLQIQYHRDEWPKYSYHLYVNGSEVDIGRQIRQTPLGSTQAEEEFLNGLKSKHRKSWRDRIKNSISLYVWSVLGLFLLDVLLFDRWLNWGHRPVGICFLLPLSWFLLSFLEGTAAEKWLIPAFLVFLMLLIAGVGAAFFI